MLGWKRKMSKAPEPFKMNEKVVREVYAEMKQKKHTQGMTESKYMDRIHARQEASKKECYIDRNTPRKLYS